MSHQNFDNYDFVSEKITQNLKDFSNSRVLIQEVADMFVPTMDATNLNTNPQIDQT